MQRCGRAERARAAGAFLLWVGSFPRPPRTRTHDSFPDSRKGSVSFDWEHEVEITNQILRMTLGLKDHTGSYVVELVLVPECIPCIRLGSPPRSVTSTSSETGSFIDSQTSLSVFLRLCRVNESWAPSTLA